jgi:peptidoglycan/xylan/chitin deacetylase (PgdA/CDA1 family)
MINLIRIFDEKALRVLMYHKVINIGKADGLTITAKQLREQFHFIKEKGYNVISLQELLDYHGKGASLPYKPVLLTFDDGYRNHYSCLYPILQEYGFNATVFLIANTILLNAALESESDYLQLSDIKHMDPDVISFGYHSYSHQPYSSMTKVALSLDIKKCIQHFEMAGLRLKPCLAYPFGAYHNREPQKSGMLQVLKEHNIQLAFRIGNRINASLLKAPYFIERIDIRGDDSFHKFQRKLKFGNKFW